ncbi:MAG TPA: serine/threonine-protein kinase [Labilithrix sp.]|nr:serine/threonine-protein kinase [Labilithrix sp.]
MIPGRRYEPLLKIASGGTAAVYVGTAAGALGFRQLVAIKIPHAHLADDAAFRAALLEEAKIAARLHHANVVDVRDVEVDDGGVQLVMDYVEGASLSELIRGWTKEPPPRPEAVAIRIVLDACEGLRALHELTGDDGAALGLVHRDVSPANVLVGLDGVARIADFGLAKSLSAVDRTTSEGTLRGKLGYMAPEYVRGKGIDHRIDVFAMGVVLWEAVARRRLFRGENDGETLDRIQTMTAPSLTATSAELGEAAADLDAVVTRALAKDRDARYPTVAALSADLEKVVRAHDLGATHGDVRDAFAPSLRAALDERRRQVQSASAATESTRPPEKPAPSVPPPSVTASVSPAALPASPAASFVSAVAPSPPRPARSRTSIVLFALAVVASAVVVAVGLTRPPRGTAAPAGPRGPASASSEVEPLAGDPNARAFVPEDLPSPASSSSASASSSARGPRAVLRLPPRASPEEPGKKPPRPNPYASAPAPR